SWKTVEEFSFSFLKTLEIHKLNQLVEFLFFSSRFPQSPLWVFQVELSQFRLSNKEIHLQF
ncbi:MAG: hypothetical protein MI748_15770, partial [Opitutales bacterium]|nr:hypothetical protein [Opitutales bacterium]